MKIDNASRIHFILFGLLALMWSASFINIKVVIDVLPPVYCAMMRVLVSLVCLGILFSFMRKKFLLYSEGVWRIWLTGLFTQALPFALLFSGERFVAPALASILNSTVSLWALLIGACVFRDTTNWTPMKIAGLLLGFAGITIIFAPSIHQGNNDAIGIIAIMGMAIAYAIGGLINQHIIFAKMKVNFETNLFQQHVSSVLVLLVATLLLEPWPALQIVFNLKVMLAFLYLGLVATALAWIIYFYLIREWGAVRTASVMYIVPVLAITWDLVFLHLVPTTAELIGAAAILMGVVLIQWARKPKFVMPAEAGI